METVKHLKRLLLKKKILMSVVVDHYSKTNDIIKWITWISILLTPLLTLLSTIYINASGDINKVLLITSTIAAGVVKIKNYMNIDQYISSAKAQSIKYEKLYQKIDLENAKPANKKQSEDDFIYWITREFNSIEMNDPEISYNIKMRYITECKRNNISYDEDIAMLRSIDVDQNTKKQVSGLELPGPSSNLDIENQTPTSIRSNEDVQNIIDYKANYKIYNNQQNINWTIERLNNLDL